MIEAMKACGKRILYLVLALALTVSLFGTAAFADGEPFQETDAYVLAFGEGVSPYAYYSPFVPTLTYDGENVNGYSILFGLKNTYTGEISEIAYCVDMPVDAEGGNNYQRLNLTDSTYAASHANKLRAIVLGSYPYLTLDKLIENSGVQGLTMFEAINGTQLAIWKTAHGDIVQITDFLSWVIDCHNNGSNGNSDLSEKEYDAYFDGDDAYKAAVKARIEKLYNYLMALEPKSATATVISEANFTSRDTEPKVVANENGGYDVTVTTTVSIPDNSNVTLTAYLDKENYTQVTNVTSGAYTLTIQNVPADVAYGAVTLSIDGTQTVSEDVFLLDAEGIRGVSQSMIAPLSGTLPVHAEVKAEPDRVLTIYKTAGGSPLQNISFDIYYVGSVDDYRAGRLSIGAAPTETDIKEYAVTTNLVGTITTDANGYGSLNFSTADGVYLVRELPNELVSDRVAFFVSLPDWMRLDENGKPSYTITAYPKNTLVEEKVEIEKDVTKLDNEHDTFDVGENHTWIIQSSIPKTIATGKAYTVTDTLDYRLTLVSVGKVALATDGGTFGNSENETYKKDESETPLGEEATVLTKDTDYTVAIGTTADGKQDTFTVSLTPAGMTKIGSEVGSDYAKYELRIYFTAYINTDATVGENIPNKAHVEYTNNLYRTYEADSDQPEVHTGGAVILKVDKNNTSKTLAGAEFEVYREVTAAEVGAEKYETKKINGNDHRMVKVSFYNTQDMSKSEGKVTTLTTDENGKGYIYGLAYGEYYLVETKAPDGYNKLAEPVKITINENSHTEAGTLTITNTSGFELPETGGIGTRAFVLGGAMLMLGACAAAVLLRRKERA